ncbi:MAG TPA: MoaD/ThiS family protein [Thiotrichales bacterium]|nr:MoaD/ThiS family protein [Thiotrichales bacterium]
MSIQVRFFASLRERFGTAGSDLAVTGPVTVADVWARVTGGAAMPDNVLCAANQEYVTPDSVVADGDEVAFFPPVTGG